MSQDCNKRKKSCTQPAFTCSELTIETLEQGVKYVPIKNKDTRTTPIVNFGQVNADWAKHKFDQMIQLYVRNDRKKRHDISLVKLRFPPFFQGDWCDIWQKKLSPIILIL